MFEVGFKVRATCTSDPDFQPPHILLFISAVFVIVHTLSREDSPTSHVPGEYYSGMVARQQLPEQFVWGAFWEWLHLQGWGGLVSLGFFFLPVVSILGCCKYSSEFCIYEGKTLLKWVWEGNKGECITTLLYVFQSSAEEEEWFCDCYWHRWQCYAGLFPLLRTMGEEKDTVQQKAFSNLLVNGEDTKP